MGILTVLHFSALFFLWQIGSRRYSILSVGFFFNTKAFVSVLYVCFQVQKLSKNEVLMVNIGSLSTGGRVSAVKADLGKIVLTNPVCTEVGEKIALSRRVEKHWR